MAGGARPHALAGRYGRHGAAAGLSARRARDACAVAPARADAVADFSQGRTLTLVVGSGPSGGYDLFGRMMARHLGRHIPGQPTIVVQNMPGAGSLRATNWLYSGAPRDGTVLGVFA